MTFNALFGFDVNHILNVSNHNEKLQADHYLDPQFLPRVVGLNLILWPCFNTSLTGIRMVSQHSSRHT